MGDKCNLPQFLAASAIFPCLIVSRQTQPKLNTALRSSVAMTSVPDCESALTTRQTHYVNDVNAHQPPSADTQPATTSSHQSPPAPAAPITSHQLMSVDVSYLLRRTIGTVVSGNSQSGKRDFFFRPAITHSRAHGESALTIIVRANNDTMTTKDHCG